MKVRLAALVLAAGVGIAAAGARAAPPSCHCFRDREYDPAHPEKSDEYLLATAANALLSAAYGMPKRDIVQARMAGTTAEDLWVGAFAAHRQRADVGVLTNLRSTAAAWRDVFLSRGGALEELGQRFAAAVADGAGDENLSRVAAAETLAARIGTPWAELDALLAGGASLQEMVLSSLLGRWSLRPAPEIHADVRGGRTGWSRLLAALGKAPKQMDSEVSRALLPPGR